MFYYFDWQRTVTLLKLSAQFEEFLRIIPPIKQGVQVIMIRILKNVLKLLIAFSFEINRGNESFRECKLLICNFNVFLEHTIHKNIYQETSVSSQYLIDCIAVIYNLGPPQNFLNGVFHGIVHILYIYDIYYTNFGQ